MLNLRRPAEEKSEPEKSDREKFAVLRATTRVWAVAPVHGEGARLRSLHGHIAARLEPGDRMVYLGGFLGRGPDVAGTMDELVEFRRHFLARPLAFPFDIAYLRGQQEEVWSKLLQLQFAPNPGEVLAWMLEQGAGATIKAYGGDPADGIAQCRAGALSITRWTNSMRATMQTRPGHYQLLATLRRAAYTSDHSLLFVHAGVDPARPLSAQGDCLWWGHPAFADLARPFGDFQRVIRGFAGTHDGPLARAFTTTLDAGCGFGGRAIAACLDLRGEILDLIEA